MAPAAGTFVELSRSEIALLSSHGRLVALGCEVEGCSAEKARGLTSHHPLTQATTAHCRPTHTAPPLFCFLGTSTCEQADRPHTEWPGGWASKRPCSKVSTNPSFSMRGIWGWRLKEDVKTLGPRCHQPPPITGPRTCRQYHTHHPRVSRRHPGEQTGPTSLIPDDPRPTQGPTTESQFTGTVTAKECWLGLWMEVVTTRIDAFPVPAMHPCKQGVGKVFF